MLLDLGLGYLALERSTPTLSPGELQRLRLATQVRSNLFGVVYVLDEPSAGLHPADTEALLAALDRLKAAGNSLFVVEHDLDVIRHADWIVDVGPAAGEHGGHILYSGPPAGLEQVEQSQTRRYLFGARASPARIAAQPTRLAPPGAASRATICTSSTPPFRSGVFTTVTGVSGSGKSSLVSQVLVELVAEHLGPRAVPGRGRRRRAGAPPTDHHGGQIAAGMEAHQAPGAGRSKADRPHAALQPGHLHGPLRSRSQAFRRDQSGPRAPLRRGPLLLQRRQGPLRNLRGRRLRHASSCSSCPASMRPARPAMAPATTPRRSRSNIAAATIADVLGMTVDAAWEFFADEPHVRRSLDVLREVGLGYLRLGQPATELSGGEAQRIKLATELQRGQRGNTLYMLDEPTTGLHPADVERLITQLDGLVEWATPSLWWSTTCASSPPATG